MTNDYIPLRDCMATVGVVNTLRSSTLGLNPQQEGTRIIVALPKVTREHRESVAKSAKAKFMETKDELRNLQNKYLKKLDNLEASEAISVPKELLLFVHYNDRNGTSFVQIADQDLHKKQQDILTVKW